MLLPCAKRYSSIRNSNNTINECFHFLSASPCRVCSPVRIFLCHFLAQVFKPPKVDKSSPFHKIIHRRILSTIITDFRVTIFILAIPTSKAAKMI